MKRRRKSLGFPPQPCGLSYKDFKSGWTFKQAYEHVAYGRGEGPRTITQRTVLREMNALKRAEYDRYQQSCEATPKAKRASDCDRICRTKSKPCGKSCVTKTKTCRKSAGDRVCSVSDFQRSFDFDAPAHDPRDFMDGFKTRRRRRPR